MIAVIQRVSEASVAVEETSYRAATGHGLLVLLCAEQGDTDSEATWIAGKIARLRIFADDEGRMNRSVEDVGGAVMVVSQFTLAGDCRKGNRPSFINAAAPEEGERLVDLAGNLLRTEHDLTVETGQFGAMMQVSLTNDGPVTIILTRRPGD